MFWRKTVSIGIIVEGLAEMPLDLMDGMMEGITKDRGMAEKMGWPSDDTKIFICLSSLFMANLDSIIKAGIVNIDTRVLSIMQREIPPRSARLFLTKYNANLSEETIVGEQSKLTKQFIDTWNESLHLPPNPAWYVAKQAGRYFKTKKDEEMVGLLVTLSQAQYTNIECVTSSLNELAGRFKIVD